MIPKTIENTREADETLCRPDDEELFADIDADEFTPVLRREVVSNISTHKLLSESPLSSIDQKLHAKSKSAVDDWVDRLLALIFSDMPDKCWMGICLLGVTWQECSTDRFFSSSSVWFNSLLSHFKNPASSRIVRVASCTSISDLLTRLSRFSNTKKDAVSHASKLILPIIKLLDEDSSEALWEGIVRLLSTIVLLFHAAFHGNYDKRFFVFSSSTSTLCGFSSDTQFLHSSKIKAEREAHAAT